MRITTTSPYRRLRSLPGGLRAGVRKPSHPVWPWLARALMALLALSGLGLGLIALVLHIDPLDGCTVLRTRTSPGIVTNIGAQPPGWSVSGPPAISIDVGTANQSFQLIRAFRFTGPIRPWITTNAGVRELVQAAGSNQAASRAGSQFQECAKRWALTRSRSVIVAQVVTWAGLLLACLALAVSGVGLFRTARFWHGFAVIGVLSLVVTATLWTASLVLARSQAQSMVDGVHSLADLVSYSKTRTSPAPIGPPRTGYTFVALGDSEFSLLGGRQPARYPTPADRACNRSLDSLAGLLENLTGSPALNLACPSAAVAAGIEGPQTRHGVTVPAQLGLLEQVRGPRVVSVGIGANDTAWSVFLGVCFASTCDAADVRTLLENKFKAQLAEFSVQNNDMLDDLKNYQKAQPVRPQVVIIGPYQPFGRTICPDTSPGRGLVLTSGELDVLDRARSELVTVLRKGAEAHGFAYVEPKLLPLCDPVIPGLGPDIQPGSSPYRFHPTAVGELKIAFQVLQALDTSRAAPAPSPTATPSPGPTGTTRPAVTPQ